MKPRRDAIASSISALLGSPSPEAPPRETKPGFLLGGLPAPGAAPPKDIVLRVPIGSITPNPRQPRTHFDEDSLADLANSIRRHGILQPLIVKRGENGGMILLAGERRLRASQIVGLEEVPVIALQANEEQMLELSIVENVQRDNLNAVEEARAYKALLNAFGWTQEQVAERVGKKRSTVANSLRLLGLSDKALDDLMFERITAGHARALLSIPDAPRREDLRKAIVTEGISVREAERRAQDAVAAPGGRRKGPFRELPLKKLSDNLDIDSLRERLIEHLGCPVRIRPKSTSAGTVEISYQTLDDLDRVLEMLGLEVG